MAQITRYMTVVLAVIQAIGLTVGLFRRAIIDTSIFSLIVVILVLTAGTAFLMWLGEQINEKGIGNGISLIIFAGIVDRIPSGIRSIAAQRAAGNLTLISIILIIVFAVLVVAGVVLIQEGTRKIPVQYAKRVVGRKMYGGQSSFIPIKVNQSGVIPIIFASCLIYFPAQIAVLFNVQWLSRFADAIAYGPISWILNFILIVFFAYFYTSMVFNPEELSDNLRKNGGFIPGVRPGSATVQYIKDVINYITLPGACFIALIAVVPSILFSFTNNQLIQAFGGTSILIMIGVALDTMSKIESQLKMYNYDGFFK